MQREVRCACNLEGVRQLTRPSSDYLAINISSNPGQLGVRLVQALGLEFATQVHAFGMDEGDVVDTDEGHDLTQVGFLVIAAAAGVDPAASGQHIGALAAEQALRTGFGVLEGHTGTQYMVEPGFRKWPDRLIAR